MAPSLAERPEGSTVAFRSCLLQWNLESVAPISLMALLLLLCIRFKRKNRHFSTRPLKRSINTSRLVRVTPLGDQRASNPKGKQTRAGTSVWEGGSLPNDSGAQAQRQMNGLTGNSHPQPRGSSPTKDLNSSPANKPGERKSRASAQGGHGTSSPAAPQQNPTTPEPLQLQELPVTVMTVKDVGSSQDMYGPIYESLRDKEITGYRESLYALGTGSAGGPNVNSNHATLGDPPTWAPEGEAKELVAMELRHAGKEEQPAADHSCGDPRESPQLWRELILEEDAANESLSEREKKLRALYARVCKKSRSPGHLQSASPGTSTKPEEEEPPPLPEKHFDVIYETLSLLGPETQDSEVLTVINQPEE